MLTVSTGRPRPGNKMKKRLVKSIKQRVSNRRGSEQAQAVMWLTEDPRDTRWASCLPVMVVQLKYTIDDF